MVISVVNLQFANALISRPMVLIFLTAPLYESLVLIFHKKFLNLGNLHAKSLTHTSVHHQRIYVIQPFHDLTNNLFSL